MEVKNKKYKKDIPIEDYILYDGFKFRKDTHLNKNHPKIINYRCINYRKNERHRNTQFCNAFVKRKEIKNNIYYILEKPHSFECVEFQSINTKIETNLVGDYNDYVIKCNKYLDSTEEYNKKEITLKLQNIYNENKYNFRLKENTIKNIIGRWKNNSLRFTKFNAIEHRYNKNNELILWDHTNTTIYTSNKKKPLPCEYFIWTSDQIISRARITNHLFVDGTFHHPKDFNQLLIILFKDIISSDYLPAFYILMSNKTEILYDLVFKSFKKILTQNGIYLLNIKTITSDSENAIVKAINNNFPNSQRIGCWFHLKQDLLRQAKIFGLLNPKNDKINPETTVEIITQLSMIPLEYNGDMGYIEKKINILTQQYPIYYNMIKGYFFDSKLKYFKDGSYNYNIFPKDIRSNSILERYNKTIKTELGLKRTCNWVVFLNFINRELDRINNILAKNENKNVLYESKHTKFGIDKFISIKEEEENVTKAEYSIRQNQNYKISNNWLIQNGNNCRYNAFITLFYFTLSPTIQNLNDKDLTKLKELNEMILKLADDVNEKNYKDIIIFLQKNKFDSNNAKIDDILNEQDESKKQMLIENLKFDDTIDFSSSGYAVQLFSIFNNLNYFCKKENRVTECVICGTKKTEIVEEMQPFIFINNNNINSTSLFNLFLSKYKENYSYACECRKNLPKGEDVLCLKIKYSIISYPIFLFLLFDFHYYELLTFKEKIFNLIEDKLVLNLKEEYQLVGMIAAPGRNHYNTIIFNPTGHTINSNFTPNNIYFHDGMLNEGNIIALIEGENWKEKGIPYIVVYKKIDN